MKRSLASFVLLLATMASALPAAAQGRGDYFNVESPPVHPIEVFRVAGYDYLAVASTRDSSIEIWDTNETLPVANRRLARIPVGQEPVSVRWHARRASLYTANFLGDSVSVVAISAPSGPASFSARLDQTVFVGDEPLDIAFYTRVVTHPVEEGGEGGGQVALVKQDTLFITHMALDGFDWRDAQTFAPINGFAMAPALVNTLVDLDGNGVPETPVPSVVKEPRTVLVRDDRLLILGSKGGKPVAGLDWIDLDLYCDPIATLGTTGIKVSGLGSAGFNMAFDASGNLFVVGFEALNAVLADEPSVAAAPTGFAKSMLWRISGACTGAPTVLARDLNEVNGASGATPVAKADALGMPMDVAIFANGAVPKVFFTAYGSDRVGVIEPNTALTSPLLWPRRKIDLGPMSGSTNPLAGPRGLALKVANPAQPNDPGARLYVLNHLDASVASINPVTELEVAGGDLPLAVDPRPAYLKTGQRFLYDHNLSGNGFSACATCHHDARLDGLAWDLGTPTLPGGTIPAGLLDPVPTVTANWPDDKGLLMTQSLQGLLNFEMAPPDMFWTTNAPYHWRADRADFTQFLPAFNSLLGLAPGSEPTPAEMKQFEEFINTVHYPPNPEQAKNRRPTGVFDPPSGTFTLGSNGLRIYHEINTDGVACVHCHSLPEGSNNRITEILDQPLETAALRGLLQKQGKRDLGPTADPRFSPYSGFEGLSHTGFVPRSPTDPLVDIVQDANLTATINGFNKTIFSGPLCGAPFTMCPSLEDLNRIVHEIDWGTGPLVGCPVTARLTNAASLVTGASTAGCDLACGNLPATLNCMEQQAREANSGIAVAVQLATGASGFFFDPVQNLYVPEGSAGAPLSRNGLLALLTAGNDRLQFQATPLGNERRLASPTGVASTLSGPAPANLRLMPLKPNSFYTNVPTMTGLWASLDNSVRKSPFVRTNRLYQWGLIQDSPAAENRFGFSTTPRHDAPRRFQVSGDAIRHGAVLFVGYWSAAGGPPNPNVPPGPGQVGLIAFPLYATGNVDAANGNRPIWETAVELEPMLYYGMMLGGPMAPGVATAFLDYGPTFTFPTVSAILDQPPAGSFNPGAWNWLHVWVANSPTSLGVGGWQRLTLQ